MGRVLLKACKQSFSFCTFFWEFAPPLKVIILGDSGFVIHYRCCWLALSWYLPQCWENIPHESICQQTFQQSVQSNHRCRLVRFRLEFILSLTFNICIVWRRKLWWMIDWSPCRSVLCSKSRSGFLLSHVCVALGHSRSGAVPVIRCCVLSRGGLLCFSIWREQL